MRSFVPLITTVAPASSKPSASARPIPRLLPVTSAFLPVRSKRFNWCPFVVQIVLSADISDLGVIFDDFEELIQILYERLDSLQIHFIPASFSQILDYFPLTNRIKLG